MPEPHPGGVVDWERLSLRDIQTVGRLLCDRYQGQRRNALIGVNQGLARTGIHPLRASPQGFLDQRLPETSVGAGHQNCLPFDCHRLRAHDSLPVLRVVVVVG